MVLAVRQFVDKDVLPVAAEHEATGRYPEAIVRELGALGVLGAVVSPDLGGLGLDGPAPAMLLEELARGWITVAGAVASHVVCTWALDRFAPSSARQARLPVLTRGEALATAVLGGAVGLRRAPEWTLDGTTALADNAPRATVFLVAATDEAGRPRLALIERNAPGLSIAEPEATLGGRGLDPCALRLDGVRPTLVLENDDAAEATVAFANVATAAVAVGLAQAAFEAALRYSQQRTTFGKPLCQHQAVQLKLADMATGITAGRLLTYHAAGAGPGGAPDPATAVMARLHAASCATSVTLETMRIHGGYGYVNEFPVERFYRDAARLLFVPLDDDTLRAALAGRLVAGR